MKLFIILALTPVVALSLPSKSNANASIEDLARMDCQLRVLDTAVCDGPSNRAAETHFPTPAIGPGRPEVAIPFAPPPASLGPIIGPSGKPSDTGGLEAVR